MTHAVAEPRSAAGTAPDSGVPFSRLLKAEARKIFTTKLWWGMLLGSIVFATIATIATMASAGADNSNIAPLTSPQTQRDVLSSAGAAALFVLVVGIIGVTTEYRHFTSRPTFLFEPRRGRVMGAKLTSYGLLGILYSIICAVVVVVIAEIWMNAKGIEFSLAENDIPRVLVGTLANVAIYAIIGVGVGVLVRNQIVAIIASVAYLFVLENLITIIPVVKNIYRVLPGGASQALTSSTFGQGEGGPELLNAWGGGLVLLGWGLLFAILGTMITARRDVP